MAVKELPKGVDADAVRSMMNDSERNFAALGAAWDNLLVEHEGEWVGAHSGEFVFGDSPQSVVDGALKRGWPLGVIAIRHLSRERPAILL